MDWRNRIVGHGEEDPALLMANPLNWRNHPKAQQDAMERVMNKVGWVQNIIVNKRTGHMIDGHMRVQIAVRRKEIAVPIVYVDLEEEEEKLILATLDPIGDMAAADKVMLDNLIRQSGSDLSDVLGQIAKQERIKQDEVIGDMEVQSELGLTRSEYMLNPNAIFYSSNHYGIPDYDENLLSYQVPTKVWAGNEFGQPEDCSEYLFLKDRIPGQFKPKGGVLACYVFDEHFEYLWKDSVDGVYRLMDQEWGSLVSPDFSVYANHPLVVQQYNYYRERWVARFWQAAGMLIIPGIAPALIPEQDEWGVGTMPIKVPVMAVQARTFPEQNHKKMFIRSINLNVEQCCPDTIIVYGGAENRNWIEPNVPKGVDYVWLSSVAKLRSTYRKGRKGRNE